MLTECDSTSVFVRRLTMSTTKPPHAYGPEEVYPINPWKNDKTEYITPGMYVHTLDESASGQEDY